MSERPWDRQPREPARAYARFQAWLLAGPNRSMLAIYRAEAQAGGKGRPARLPGSWLRAADRYRWRERAAAWDKAEAARRLRDYEAAGAAEWQARIDAIRELHMASRELLRALGGVDDGQAPAREVNRDHAF